jgi:hypothetical protein
MVAGPIPETIKGDQDSYPLQNPLRRLSLSGIPLSEKERNPRQVNNENDGRFVGTRTPDLYRVKGQLTNTLNNLESDGDRLSTPKYV